jgi:hypothetical protein
MKLYCQLEAVFDAVLSGLYRELPLLSFYPVSMFPVAFLHALLLPIVPREKSR